MRKLRLGEVTKLVQSHTAYKDTTKTQSQVCPISKLFMLALNSEIAAKYQPMISYFGVNIVNI